MLSHYPTYFGEVDILPNEHIKSVEMMDGDTYDEINELTITIYPIFLSLIGTQDCNIGFISYGNTAELDGHIKQQIIPRKHTWRTSPITRSSHINGDILQLYKKLHKKLSLFQWERKAKI